MTSPWSTVGRCPPAREREDTGLNRAVIMQLWDLLRPWDLSRPLDLSRRGYRRAVAPRTTGRTLPAAGPV